MVTATQTERKTGKKCQMGCQEIIVHCEPHVDHGTIAVCLHKNHEDKRKKLFDWLEHCKQSNSILYVYTQGEHSC